MTGPVAIAPPAGARVVPVQSTEDLLESMTVLCPEQDVVIQAAAPADYRPERPAEQKLKKQGDGTLTLHMVSTPDVARSVGQAKKQGQTLVGFAAETQNLTEHALDKMRSKALDMIVANDVTQSGAGFDVDTNIVTLITRDRVCQLPLMKKTEAAELILDEILHLREASCTPG